MSKTNPLTPFFARISAQASNFRWLELPPLNGSSGPAQDTRALPVNPLEGLLAGISSEEFRVRNFSAPATAGREWTTAQVMVQVERQ